MDRQKFNKSQLNESPLAAWAWKVSDFFHLADQIIFNKSQINVLREYVTVEKPQQEKLRLGKMSDPETSLHIQQQCPILSCKRCNST